MPAVKNSEHHEKAQEKKPDSAKVDINVDKMVSEAEVGAETAKVAAEVADLGIDSAESAESAEGFKEGGRSKARDPSPKGKKQTKQTQKDLKSHIHKAIPQKKMQKQVASAIRKEIRREERKVLLAYAGVKKYPPHKLAEMIAKIRSLKDLLASLVDATKEILTGLYMKWVHKET